MKRFAIILMSLFLAVSMSAQEHMTFEGLEIKGFSRNFIHNLRSVKFKQQKSGAIEGKHLGEKCELYLVVTPKTDKVYMVAVAYPICPSWQLLKTRYESMKSKLIVRYGLPSVESESFLPPYTEEDGINAVVKKGCAYISTFVTDAGEISISISEDARVYIFYTDKAGSLQSQEEILPDLGVYNGQ
ncbi:MAG: hypothetical protein II637_01455 [Bacteroidales bacterium]|nr:hypothetical protein [Bacteroidales bacterium]